MRLRLVEAFVLALVLAGVALALLALVRGDDSEAVAWAILALVGVQLGRE